MPRSRPSTKSARDFVLRNGRLLDRYRLAFHLDREPADRVVATLLTYQNGDGGFGNALEPDLRGPESQPIPVWTAVSLLDEVGVMDRSVLRSIFAYLGSISDKNGGIPFVLPSVRPHPHAPWWNPPRRAPPPSLNPTAGLAGLFHKNRISHPWVDRASAWCWDQIERLTATNPYELRVVLHFLDHVPDAGRAERALERLRPMILDGATLELDPSSKREGFRPLDVSPEPKRLSRTLFDDRQIEKHLDRVVRLQESDGGWNFDFPVWTPVTRFEWRGCITVDTLHMLQLNGRA
jgi:hypothetical protein